MKYKYHLCKIEINAEELYWLKVETPKKISPSFQFLFQQHSFPKFYWTNREKDFEVSTFGSSYTLDSTPLIKEVELLEGTYLSSLRLYGGLSFSSALRKSSLWKAFPDICFFIPKYELITSSTKSTLYYNAVFFEKPQIKEVLDSDLFSNVVFETKKVPCITKNIDELTHSPSYETWGKNLESVAEKISSNDLKKAVLARKSTAKLDNQITPDSILNDLEKEASSNFLFAIQFSSKSTFLGSSPERLYKKDHDKIQTEAVAGTIQRSHSQKKDDALGNLLLKSAKDINEIQYVIDHILNRLTTISSSDIIKDEISLLKTTNIQHLYMGFQANLIKGITNREIIEALHPTPAICGLPSLYAMHLISTFEPFDRGWYAAPIGWLSQDQAEFCVAIRSCLVEKLRIHFFTGGGIVKKSEPKKEWHELNHKLKTYQSLFNDKAKATLFS